MIMMVVVVLVLVAEPFWPKVKAQLMVQKLNSKNKC